MGLTASLDSFRRESLWILPGFEAYTVEPVASNCTNYAILAQLRKQCVAHIKPMSQHSLGGIKQNSGSSVENILCLAWI